MELKVFSIFDEKALVFRTPIFMCQTGQVVRAFDSLVNDKQSEINRYPADFKLYEMGTFDDNSGLLVSLPQPKYVCAALDFFKPVAKAED